MKFTSRGVRDMKLKVFLTLFIAFIVLLSIIRIGQFLVLKFMGWDFSQMENVLMPVILIVSVLVGTVLASRRRQ
jgi:hypothetical protein